MEQDEPAARERLWPILLTYWLIASTILILVSKTTIQMLDFGDPDDAMRLLEVHDWLAGQSWWDVSQHRLWGGHFAMHWSRLVDLPLAGGMALLDPLVGKELSNRITLTAIPLLSLLGIMALVGLITRRLAGTGVARLAILLSPLTIPLMAQIRPTRIDHHAWQVILALAAVAALLARPTARSGAIAGAALAALLTISLEGMPITAAILGTASLTWALIPARRAQLVAMAASLPVVLLLLHVTTRGPGALLPACDAIAPAWLAAIGIGVGGILLTAAIAPRSLIARLALLGAAGLAAAAALRGLAPLCTRGPFATLDPLVYRYWYLRVEEGLPIWDQSVLKAVVMLVLPVIGLVGSTLAWRASRGETRICWAMLIGLTLSALALCLLVLRAGVTANALALPGAAWLVAQLVDRTRNGSTPARRIAAGAGALVALTPAWLGSTLIGSLTPAGHAVAVTRMERPTCLFLDEVPHLTRLPAAIMFTPLDLAPSLLAHTAHSAIAAGYHRNDRAMHDVIAGFMDPPDEAKSIILASDASYLVACPGADETERYKRVAPTGLWARLERGERFDWLQPVDLHGTILVWRVLRRLPSGSHGR
ncbi:hypothetical protein F9288_01335 [Sphingomonas sp. CL5.1]|uniref:hypothetical protein n=1 Tax=Sphingomonas sp. CL5.1 TaxID=2653203 RepID=UPI0015834FA1|nr:hypothetical protein [Sphingomonas sp. CL5.1]QKR98438.1 hypothetical protein F9288_01335 [Sphingomonas sp. CL5.1]